MLSINHNLDLLQLPPADPMCAMIAVIQGKELWWDDRDGCPVWPDDEPMTYAFDPDGSVVIEPLLDVYRVPVYVRQPRQLACGHQVRAGDFFCTLLVGERNICLSCAEEAHQ